MATAKKRPQTAHDREMKEIRAGFAESWRLIQETNRGLKESERILQETNRILRDTNRSLEETNRGLEETNRSIEDTDRIVKANARSIEDTDRIVRANARQLGGFLNGEGRKLEIECIEALEAKGEIGGIRIDSVRPWPSVIYGKGLFEFDIALLNGKIVVVAEVKRMLYAEDVEWLVERLPIFSKAFPEYSRGRQTRGAVIFSRADESSKREDPVKLALKSGLIVVQAVNKNRLQDITSPGEVRRRQSVKGKRAAVKKR